MSRIQVRRGTAFEWTAADPTLFQGEFGLEIDTNKVKLGDGTSIWSELPYVSLDWATLLNKPAVIAAGATGADARNAISAEYTGNKGASGGYASLDGDGLVPLEQLPITTADWDTLDGKPPVVAAGATEADARDVIDAEYTGNKGQASGYASLDASGLVPTEQLPITQAAWDTLDGKPAVVAAGATESDARTAISAEYTGDKGQANGYASLDGGGKVPVAQLPNSIMEYQGLWNADTNTSPTLADGTGSPGDVYRVSTAGSRNLGSGPIAFEVGDYVIYNGTTWEKSDTTDAVASVNGYTGNVTLAAADVGLGDVDDTSDDTKNAAVATLTNKTISGSSNTLTNVPVSGLSTTGSPGSTTFLRGDGSWADPVLLLAEIDGGSPSATDIFFYDGGTV